ncbi:diaminobutyrate--2-oxoglutarate transaminase [Rubinisphaera sp.]|uniref:diaminobutyrate--2-oxoglutarate transaminase n=1 Tax=Rubinisphaera sp. TaxID=2024857 RepID=UPI000C0EB864|nr:diaminobutyrate--2-oxoglutarate transaminase [Rubinisphaera sp.]MBV09996.1 diaminobutyrate--2-oxoglutarate transaminase [Rubinisphaera sp.]HCS54616.1 diaminobutyrate--2-oxoglutarate transaminase [Planctomycetaceae bacterium]|tara:strand:+ start:23074 stop:24333 length:1260 start_codon:yes stop_codon:yes gene_type:complete
MDIFERLESNVRGYCRSFPTVFKTAKGATLLNEQGEEFIDFFAGAGALSYGHNNPELKSALIEYLTNDGVLHALDMSTTAKRKFLETFERLILNPRQMDYKVMFPGPTGTNAVESALKLARKITGRHNIVSFTNGFHGMTLGSLALTGNGGKRAGAGVPLNNVTHMPFCDYLGTEADTIAALERYLEDSSSGMDLPAAFILETVQAEGGVNIGTRGWLEALAGLARRYNVLLIIDDIQVGCGRTGPFFSFEPFDIQPDIICLSKSISGYGLPMALTLMKPDLDVFEPGEHNGTFRGHNAAFITATAALEEFWQDDQLTQKVNRNARQVRDSLLDIAAKHDAEVRGRGMIQGIEFADHSIASAISKEAFTRGLIIETAGPDDEVIKTLPPLTISDELLTRGLEILAESTAAAVPELTCAK